MQTKNSSLIYVEALLFHISLGVFDYKRSRTSIDPVSCILHQYVLSRMYNRGWTPPDFSLIYNLVASLKTCSILFENDLIFLKIYFRLSVLGILVSFNDKGGPTASFTTTLETETILVERLMD